MPNDTALSGSEENSAHIPSRPRHMSQATWHEEKETAQLIASRESEPKKYRNERNIGGILFALSMCVVVVLALLDHPVFASRFFAVILAIIGVVRVVYRRRRVWFAWRRWWVDALVLFITALAIAYLSFYGGQVMPTLAFSSLS